MQIMRSRPWMLCEGCRSAKAYRETTREDDGLQDGLILCPKCRADRKAGERSKRTAKADVNPDSAFHHRRVALAR